METGCKPPNSVLRPGNETSMLSFANFAFNSAVSNAAFFAFNAFCAICFASLIFCPTAGRSSAGTSRKPCINDVKCPFLPKYSTFNASSAATSEATFTASTACATKLSKFCILSSKIADEKL